MSEWKPIETIPDEGSFLVYMPGEPEGRQIQVAYWHPNVKVIGGVFDFDREPVTHWMELPDIPNTTNSKGE